MANNARIRFADPSLDEIAFALCHTQPLAAQYLEQAPVLTILASGKLGVAVTYGEADSFSTSVAAQPKLRDVLQAYGAAAPVRKLSNVALRGRDRGAVAELLRLDASTLSQCIPDAENQRLWLDGISKWLRLMPSTKAGRKKFNIAWIARQLAADCGRVEVVDSLVDFVARGDRELNDRWTWARAMAEVQAWHKRLRDEAAIRALVENEARARALDTVICKAPLPDSANDGVYDFVVLRTARQLREEGAALHHCVASYARDVKEGRCAIVSIRRDGVNVATLEITKKGEPRQIKAHCNAAPASTIQNAAAAYALRHWKAEAA